MNILLVVADERAICESLRAALPDEDLLLFESSADRALRRLASLKVDAILVDDAPNLGHAAVARMIETAPAIPVVVLSSRGDTESLASWTLAGARACIVKPFSCEALRAALDGVTRRRDHAPIDDLQAQEANSIGRAGRIPSDTAKAANGDHPAFLMPPPTSAASLLALRWVSRTSSHIEDPKRVSQSLADAVIDIFDAVRCAVLLETPGGVRVVASHGIPPNVADSLRLSFATGLMRWFDQNACLFDRFANTDAPAAIKELQLLGGRLAVPLLSRGRVCGVLVIGEKASGPAYAHEERELLSVIGRCASTALEKAQVYRDTSAHQGQLDNILANITAGVVAVLPNKTISMMNQQAENILQVRAADVLGRSVQKLGSGFSDVVLRTLVDGKPRLRQEVRDPAINALLGLSVTPLGNEGVVVIFSKLPEQTVSKNEIAYSPFWEYLSQRVAQEIKNPMVAINTFAQLLPRKYDSEDFRDAFSRVVQKEVSRINSVVETLFAFAARPDLVLTRTDLNETIRSVLLAFEDELSSRSIKVEAHLDPSTAEADLDAAYFTQAIQNLVQNSVDAMPSGGTLRITTKRENNTCQVVVADTGPGIPPDQAPLIFMPFYSTKERGMGLGLTTAMRIVRQHDGDLKLVETPEGGAAFSMSFPAAKSSHENHSDH